MTHVPPEIRVVRPAERAGVGALLADAGLPAAGLDAHWDHVLVAVQGSVVVGSAALEVYPPDALLRSVAVAPDLRGAGLGVRLTEAALEWASERAVRAVYLLTETAEGFFPRFGFGAIPRADVPDTVQRSVEFRGACPDSATVMRLVLG